MAVLLTLAFALASVDDFLELSAQEGLTILEKPALTSGVVKRYVARRDRHYMVTFGDDVKEVERIEEVVQKLHDIYNGGDSEKQEYLYIGSVTHHEIWKGFSIHLDYSKGNQYRFRNRNQGLGGDGLLTFESAQAEEVAQRIRGMPGVKTVHKTRVIKTSDTTPAPAPASDTWAPTPSSSAPPVPMPVPGLNFPPSFSPSAAPTGAAFTSRASVDKSNWFQRDSSVPLPWGLDRIDQVGDKSLKKLFLYLIGA